jgi:hypothetical protein
MALIAEENVMEFGDVLEIAKDSHVQVAAGSALVTASFAQLISPLLALIINGVLRLTFYAKVTPEEWALARWKPLTEQVKELREQHQHCLADSAELRAELRIVKQTLGIHDV